MCLEPEPKDLFHWGENPIRVSLFLRLPHFTPNWHPHNGFSMGALKHFSDVVCGQIRPIAIHSSNDVSWWPSTPECQKRVKGGMARVT